MGPPAANFKRCRHSVSAPGAVTSGATPGHACGYRLQAIAVCASIDKVNSRHRKTLAAIFARPTAGSLAFADIERLLVGIGAALSEGEGSRVKFSLRGQEWHAHRPHPGKEARKYQIEGVREFLERLEIKP